MGLGRCFRGLQHLGHKAALIDEFFVRGGDLRLGEVVHFVAGDDFVAAGRGGAHGHASPDVRIKAVEASLFTAML